MSLMAKIHFLNVDEGDCSIIQHDNGNVTMIGFVYSCSYQHLGHVTTTWVLSCREESPVL